MERRWQCPSCDRQLVTHDDSQQPRLHPCKKLAGLLAPFVESTALVSRHVVIEREDFIGEERVQFDGDGRPVMGLRTERPDGSSDLIVFAPIATATGNAHK